MRHPPMAAGWIDRPHQQRGIGDLRLESGESLRDCMVSWVEHGQRDAAGRNTILACCAIGSTHHRLDFLIGPGRALDTNRWHVVAIDALGNGLSSSPSNSAAQAGATFPRISIRDMVASQHRLLGELGIPRLHAVAGASMGGMQALQWAVSHPAHVSRVVAMTPMARTARWSQLVNELARRALFEDPECTLPRARADAMHLWVPLTQLVVATSPRLVEEFVDRDELQRFIGNQERWFSEHGADPFDWLAQSRAYDAHDVGATPGFGGDVEAALRSITARTLVMAPALDLYNPEWAAKSAARIMPSATFVEIPSIRGHRAAAAADPDDGAFLNEVIGRFLAT